MLLGKVMQFKQNHAHFLDKTSFFTWSKTPLASELNLDLLT